MDAKIIFSKNDTFPKNLMYFCRNFKNKNYGERHSTDTAIERTGGN